MVNVYKLIHPTFNAIIFLLPNCKYNCQELHPSTGTYTSYFNDRIISLHTEDGDLTCAKSSDKEYLFFPKNDFDPNLYTIISNRGGVGNQLFAYSYALYLTTKYDITVKLARYHDLRRIDQLTGNFCLSDKVKFASDIEIGLFPRLRTNAVLEPPVIKYKRLDSYTLPVKYKWIQGNEKELRKVFTLTRPLDEANLAFLEQIQSSENPVMLHIRIGDYASAHLADAGYARLELTDYYDKAIALIRSKVKNPKFFIFCEDSEFINMYFLEHRHAPEFVYVDCNVDDETKAVFELELMKHCKHFIIANSTFSYWAAFLNDNPDKIVIGPTHWSNNDNIDELLDPSWIRV